MSVKMQQTTDQKKLLRLITVVDSAIDWDASYPDPMDLQEDEESEMLDDVSSLPKIKEVKAGLTPTEEKKEHYKKHHDETKLKYKGDDAPTVFVFSHPHRADVARKMREIASGIYSDSQRGKKDKAETDMFTAVFNHFFVGVEEGFGADLVRVKRINGRVTDELIQSLEDAEVFLELNSAFMSVYNEDRTKKKDKNHHEK